MFCPNCGTNLSDETKFCTNCGAPIESAVDSVSVAPPPAAPAPAPVAPPPAAPAPAPVAPPPAAPAPAPVAPPPAAPAPAPVAPPPAAPAPAPMAPPPPAPTPVAPPPPPVTPPPTQFAGSPSASMPPVEGSSKSGFSTPMIIGAVVVALGLGYFCFGGSKDKKADSVKPAVKTTQSANSSKAGNYAPKSNELFVLKDDSGTHYILTDKIENSPEYITIKVKFIGNDNRESIGTYSFKKNTTDYTIVLPDGNIKTFSYNNVPTVKAYWNAIQPYIGGNSSSVASEFSMGAIKSVTATSADRENNMVHSPDRTIDGDLRTAWAEGVPGLGQGESIFYSFDGNYTIRGMEIWPGHQKTEGLFERNARPATIMVEGDSGKQLIELADRYGKQTIRFTNPITTRNLKLTIHRVYRGSKWEDTCITEVRFF